MQDNHSNRRDFLRKTGLASTAMVTGLSLPQLTSKAAAGTSSHLWSKTTEDTHTTSSIPKRLVQTTTLEWINARFDPYAGTNGG